MNRNLFTAALLVVSALTAVTIGCQTYDFQPVEPLALAQDSQYRDVLAKRVAPNMMLVVDKSGSMNQPTDPSLAACQVTGGTCPQGSTLCPASCPTRWSSLQSALNGFFAVPENQVLARFGMSTFPTDKYCSVDTTNPSKERVAIPLSDDPTALQGSATQVNSVLQGIQMVYGGSSQSGTDNATGGGTPTGLSIKQAGDKLLAIKEEGRANVILLLTDGLPNCNPENPNDYGTDPVACKCTFGGCTDQVSPPLDLSRLGCLDRDGTVAQIAALKTQGVSTFVVGLGSETGSGDGPVVLSAMADAGGYARTCPNGTDAECNYGTGGTNVCDVNTRQCTTRFYQAKDSAELSAAIKKIGEILDARPPCLYQLSAPVQSQDFISVLAGPNKDSLVRQPPGADTWHYDATHNEPGKCVGPCVVLDGALCQQATTASTTNPLRVEVRAITPL